MWPMYPYRRLAVWEICIVILAFVMMGFQIYHGSLEPRNIAPQDLSPTQIEEELRVEFNKIAPLPGATVVGTSHGNKYEMAWVDSRYNSTLTMTEIYQWYNEQFVKNGWQFYKEKSVTDWGKDYGDKQFIYKKGYYDAVLDYTAPDPNLHQTFVVYTCWGFHSD